MSDKRTIKQLKIEIKKRGLDVPTKGSGKNGNVVKKDLIKLLSNSSNNDKEVKSKKIYATKKDDEYRRMGNSMLNIASDTLYPFVKQNLTDLPNKTNIKDSKNLYDLLKEDKTLMNNLLNKYNIQIESFTLPASFISLFRNIRKTFLTSLNPRYRKTVEQEIGDGRYSVNFVNSNIYFDTQGNVTDFEIDEDGDIENLQEIIDQCEYISSYFSYEFGSGHIDFNKKHVPDWSSPIVNKNRTEEEWDKEITDKLSTLDDTFKYPFIDFDSDFGYQGIIFNLSRTPENPIVGEEDVIEGDE